MSPEKCKQGVWSRPHWTCCDGHRRIQSSLWLQLQVATDGSRPMGDPLYIPWGSTPLYLKAPYLFLCEAVGAFCKLSDPLGGATEQLNILHHFSCNRARGKALKFLLVSSSGRKSRWRLVCCTFSSPREMENLAGEQKARLQNTSEVKPVQVWAPKLTATGQENFSLRLSN